MHDSREASLYLVNFMAWADEEILRACSLLSVEELNRDMGISHTGVLGTLRHMFVAEYDWLVRLRHSMTDPDADPAGNAFYARAAPGPDLPELTAIWRPVWPGWRAFIADLAEEDFDRDFYAMGNRIPRGRLIQHVGNHATLHRGQVMGLLRQMGKQPPCTDLFEYHLLHGAVHEER
ncbi:MAG TPA: DinB family protein [Terracidiphilus sp.]|jgi:uncharacterized damage-inducible protein DinB|nr:DinB family protein [Terracidiphilus sp.]